MRRSLACSPLMGSDNACYNLSQAQWGWLWFHVFRGQKTRNSIRVSKERGSFNGCCFCCHQVSLMVPGASVALPDWWEAWTEKSLSRVLLCASMDCSPWILQARTLEWVAFPFSRGSSQARDWTQVSRIAGGFFTSWTTREAREYCCEWVAYSFSRGPSWPRNRTAASCIAGGFFTNRATREALVGGGRFINCILDAS